MLKFVVASLQLPLAIAKSVELRANLLRRETDRGPTTSTCMYSDVCIFSMTSSVPADLLIRQLVLETRDFRLFEEEVVLEQRHLSGLHFQCFHSRRGDAQLDRQVGHLMKRKPWVDAGCERLTVEQLSKPSSRLRELAPQLRSGSLLG